MATKRMTGKQRREQLIDVGKSVFARRGYDAASVEEIAQEAQVSKPVIYQHFGGKEGLYAVVIDREMALLEQLITQALDGNRSRQRIEQAVLALLTYIEEHTEGFRILVRERTTAEKSTGYASLLNDTVSDVTHILVDSFDHHGLDSAVADLYAQALVGMVSMTAQWWLDVRHPAKEVVAAHIVNLSWNGLRGMETHPTLRPVDNPPAVPETAAAVLPRSHRATPPVSPL